jgi:hypothetical protein
MMEDPIKKPSGRPKETINASIVAQYLKDKHTMRCSTEVRSYACRTRSKDPQKWEAMKAMLDRAVEEAHRNRRRMVNLQDLQVAHENSP